MDKITPCLWFDGNAEEAANFYVSLLPDSRIDRIDRAPMDYPAGRAGDVLLVAFMLAGRSFTALNGGPEFRFDQAVSFQIATEDQAETDRLWNAIVGNGGEESVCSWCKDRFGLSWQVVPKRLTELLGDSDPNRARRAMEAMMGMTKIDVAALERAAGGA